LKILVTGSKGFIGKNLVAELRNQNIGTIFEYDLDTKPELLDLYTKECDFVYHLAGVNRPEDPDEFVKGNCGFTSTLLEKLKANCNKAPVLITSSTQACFENPYGKSKREAEDLLFHYSEETGTKIFIYRLPNVFGKWCRPNYNSVVATFCYNIARSIPIKINNADAAMDLVYIDDVVQDLLSAFDGNKQISKDGFCYVPRVFKSTVGQVAGLIENFNESRKNLVIPGLGGDFERFIYATFVSYLPETEFSYPLEMKRDNRGWLSEFIKSEGFGQIFVSRTIPGITRGNHWHHTKVEKFLVIEGNAVVKFRKIDNEEVIEYPVSGEKLEVVDIPTGYTHSITNTGDCDLITLFWSDQIFDQTKPDTYYLGV